MPSDKKKLKQAKSSTFDFTDEKENVPEGKSNKKLAVLN